MTHAIVSFPSGFFGIKTVPEGIIYRADLIKWDGKKGTNYPHELNDNFNYYIDANNTVYYSNPNINDCMIWCSGKDLNRHCHHLAQIKAR